MVIDFRIRPPTKSFTNISIYPPLGDKKTPFFGWHSDLPQSVQTRSLQQLLTEMQGSDVTHAVVWGRSVRHNPAKSVANEDVAAIIHEHQGLFSGFGGIGLPGPGDIEAAVRDVEHAIKDLRLRGITIELAWGATQMRPDHPRLYPIFERCKELGGLLAFSISRNRNSETESGYSTTDAIDRIAEDFPAMPIVIGHAFWPSVEQSCGLAFRRRNVYLLPDVYGLPGMPGYSHWVDAANTFMEDRMLFGSSYPLLGVKAVLESYRTLPYKTKVLDKVLYGNAARLLNM